MDPLVFIRKLRKGLDVCVQKFCRTPVVKYGPWKRVACALGKFLQYGCVGAVASLCLFSWNKFSFLKKHGLELLCACDVELVSSLCIDFFLLGINLPRKLNPIVPERFFVQVDSVALHPCKNGADLHLHFPEELFKSTFIQGRAKNIPELPGEVRVLRSIGCGGLKRNVSKCLSLWNYLGKLDSPKAQLCFGKVLKSVWRFSKSVWIKKPGRNHGVEDFTCGQIFIAVCRKNMEIEFCVVHHHGHVGTVKESRKLEDAVPFFNCVRGEHSTGKNHRNIHRFAPFCAETEPDKGRGK